MAVCVIGGGVAVGFVGRWLDRHDDEGIGHSLYFIPVKYWGALAVSIGIGLFFTKPDSPQNVSAREKALPTASLGKSSSR
jgi:hypothetical protein